MARSRMIDVDFINSDKFCDLSDKSQLLYIRLMMAADDDGFCGKPKQVMRSMGADKTELDDLVNAGYIHIFDSGVCLIMDWCIHNHIQPSRHRKESLYTAELAQIEPLRREVKSIKTKDGEDTREEIKYARYVLKSQNVKAEPETWQEENNESQYTDQYAEEKTEDSELPWE